MPNPVYVTDLETGKSFSFMWSCANRLGVGRYGVVFRGTCLQTQMQVAVKLIGRRQYGNEQRALKYFKREVETLKIGSGVSANVVKLLGSVEDHERFVIVTEFCEKGDMSGWMDDALRSCDGYQEQLATVLEAYVQLATGLFALHKQRILHRDLKGSGMARSLLDADDLTLGVGTNGFMAPEIMRGGAYETQSDLYSLGMMLTRDLAKVGIDIETSYHCIHLNRIVKSLTSADPQERATLDSLLNALMDFMVCR
ncbi:protein kinase domain protein [Aphelenchoides avenae]|nr:protein kinase domain protein [Aphelenchus avenae]